MHDATLKGVANRDDMPVVDIRPRPDLTKILPVPMLRQTSDALPPLQTVRPVQQRRDGDDWFVDVHRQPTDQPGSAAFQAGLVRGLATRVREQIVGSPQAALAAHGHLDPVRAQDALDGKAARVATAEEHRLPACPPCVQRQGGKRARDHP